LLYTIDPANTTDLREQRLWSATDNSDISLSDLIPNYPEPPYNVREAYWSPDSTKILFAAWPDDRHEIPPGHYYDFILSVVNLNQRTFTDNQFTYNQRVVWLTNDAYILRLHCGSPCASVSAYDYTGRQIWSPDWYIGGMIAFAPNGNFMINVGRIDSTPGDGDPSEPYPATVDEINLSTGEVTVNWQRPREGDYFTPFLMPQISPDEQFFSFDFGGIVNPGTLYIVDRNGREYGQFVNSYALGWRPNGGLALSETLPADQQRLLYFTIDGNTQSVFTTTQGVEIANDIWLVNQRFAWSPDGRFFAFTTHNNNQDTEQLYLWQPDNGEPRLIYSTDPGYGIYDLTWLPNSQGFYFTVGNELWRYDVEPAAS
jgi:WD40 repeat protein